LSDEKIELSTEFIDSHFEVKTGGSSEKGNKTLNTIFPSDNRMSADEQKKIVEKWAVFDKEDLDKKKSEDMKRAAVIRMQKEDEAQARDYKAKDAVEAAKKRLAAKVAKAAEAKKKADAADKIKTDAPEAATRIEKDAPAVPETSFLSLRPYLTKLNLWSANYVTEVSSLLVTIRKNCKKSAKCALTTLN
jgi:ATP-dependent helicase YprA (DUF1998 family)